MRNIDTDEEKGYAGARGVSGVRRPIGVDSRGLPHLLSVTFGNISDKRSAREMITTRPSEFQSATRCWWTAVTGYEGQPFASFAAGALGARVEAAKRSGLHKFAVIPKKRIVERSFAWLEKCRRLWKYCERKLSTFRAMM